MTDHLPHTTPVGQLRLPTAPWLDHDGCRVCRSARVATVSLYGGRRCAAHPDQFSPDIAIRLRLDGWNDTANAYIRTWAEING